MEDKKESLIDLTYLKTFSDGDMVFVKEMIELFIEKIPTETAELQRAVAAQEWQAAYKAAHDLKSSANFIGLTYLVEDILKFEDCTKNQRNFDLIPDLRDRIVEECLKGVTELKGVEIPD